jgi:nuclear pore complex protein Nup205
MTRGISPAEINGLASVLRLVGAVTANCEAARVAMAENSSWQPILLLLGLLGCGVPTHLKAELLRTLAALAKSPEVAHIVWQNVEAAQLVATVQTGPSGKWDRSYVLWIYV